jgi:predicted MFS family arabinose efflux permease
MLAATFSSLRDRRFAVFFAAQTLSNTGTWMERAGVASLVYSLSGHDERWLAVVALVPAIPALLLSIPAGALVDRADLRRLILGTQCAMLVLAAVLAAFASAGLVRPWHLAVYVLLSSTVFALDAPARQSFVPRLVVREDLTNALALSTVTFNAARLAGGAAFAVVVARTGWGEPGCFWLNAASFLFSVAAIAWIRANPLPSVPTDHATHGLLQGLRFTWRNPVLRAAALLALLSSLLGFQISHLVPVYAEKVWRVGKPGQGTLHASIGLGALAGALSLAFLSRRVARGAHVLRTSFLGAAFLVAAAATESFVLGCWLLAGAGFLLIQTHTGCNAILQTLAPDALRGRVVALYTMCILGAFPVGGYLAARAAHVWGARITTGVAGTLLAVSVVAVALTHRELARAR